MAALRKKYQGRADIEPSKDAPVMSEPPSRTTLPPVDNSPPPPDLSASAQSDPVEQAEQVAIKQRLRELERAESVAQQPQPPQFAPEEQPQQNPLEQVLATVPVAARGWLRSHPQYLTDPEKNAQIQHAHLVAARETGDGEFGPRYYARLEQHLGLRPQRQPQQSARAAPRPAASRQAFVSAPPTRESVSLATGRPTSDRVRLTGEEREFAAMLGLSENDYAAQKALMLRTQQS